MSADRIEQGVRIPGRYLCPKGETTFQYEADLPSLPVPPLHQSLDKYLDSVRPHVSDAEFAHTRALASQFAAEQGEDLQRRLEKRGEQQQNWLSEWWLRYAYLMNRLPMSPHQNPATVLHDLLPGLSHLQQAAASCWLIALFWDLMRREEYAVEKTKAGEIFGMWQFHRAFSAARVPKETVDDFKFQMRSVSMPDSANAPTHIVVICRQRFFHLEMLSNTGKLRPPHEVYLDIAAIHSMCERTGEGPGLGVLTAAGRDEWAEAREHLLKISITNRGCIEAIDKALVMVVLDDHEPKTQDEIVSEVLTGNPNNRWFDKHTFIFFKNCTAGLNGEHSFIDGMSAVSLKSFVFSISEANDISTWKALLTNAQTTVPSEPLEIIFTLDDVMHTAISDAREVALRNFNNLESCMLEFHDYGRDFIKGLGVHPDAYIQMALQLAYFRLYNKAGATYESASTRKFYQGRTDTTRSCTTEAVAWARSMLDHDTTAVARGQLLRAAYMKYVQLMTEAMDGQGCDRHLLGIYILALEGGQPTPEIFTDPAFVRSGGGGHFILSTSLMGYSSVDSAAYAPMCDGGYGISYVIPKSFIRFGMTRWRSDHDTDIHKMFNSIVDSLRDMRTLSEQAFLSKT